VRSGGRKERDTGMMWVNEPVVRRRQVGRIQAQKKIGQGDLLDVALAGKEPLHIPEASGANREATEVTVVVVNRGRRKWYPAPVRFL
jgi:hypothetical protein